MSLTICVDIDGVLADIEPEMERRICEHFGKEQVQIDRKHFYLEDRYGIDKKEMQKFKHSPDLFQDPGFWMMALPFRTNIDRLSKWYDKYHVKQIFLVTGRNNSQREATETWLDQYKVRYDGLLMGTLGRKVEIMEYLDADFIIEDRFEEVWEVAKRRRMAYIVERSYNLHHKEVERQGRYLDHIQWIRTFTDIEFWEKFKYA